MSFGYQNPRSVLVPNWKSELDILHLVNEQIKTDINWSYLGQILGQ